MGNESQNTVFLPEGSKRERGKDAQRMNIMVAIYTLINNNNPNTLYYDFK